MRRRQFLQTVGAGAPATLVVTGSTTAMNPVGNRKSKRREEPRVFFTTSGATRRSVCIVSSLR